MRFFVLVLLIAIVPFDSGVSAAPVVGSIGSRSVQAVGDAIPIVELDGTAIGSVTVTAFQDSGSAANVAPSCCALGSAFMTLAVTALAEQLMVDRASIQGFVTTGSSAIAKMNNGMDMATGLVEVPAGETVSVDAEFWYQSQDATDTGTSVARVIWARTADSFITLLDLRTPVALGSAQMATSGPLPPIANMSLLTLADPLIDVRESSTAPDGYRNVGVTVAIECTDTVSVGFEAAAFRIVATDGRSFSATDDVVRLNSARAGIPELVRETIDPGATYEGFLAFRLPVDAEIASVIFYLPYGQNKILISLFDAVEG